MPSYQLKRTYQAGYTPAAKRARREAKLVRRTILNKPETKVATYAITFASLATGNRLQTDLLGQIVQGDAMDQRSGTKIRVLSVNVRGRPFGDINNGDFHLIVPNRGANGTEYDDFVPAVGGHYLTENGWCIMHATRDGAAHQTINYTYKWPLGMIVHYDRPTTEFPAGLCTKNNIWAVIVNSSGGNMTNMSYSVRITYTDA